MINIAFVDDHRLLRQSMGRILEEKFSDSKIYHYDSGNQFIDIFLTQNYIPDIVLMDIAMPGINGYDTSLWLLKQIPNVKILILTNTTQREAIQFMIGLGVKGVVSKSLDMHILLEAIKQVLKGFTYFNCGSNIKIVKSLMFVDGKKVKEGLAALTNTEKKILCSLCTQEPIHMIAKTLNISERTFDSHKLNIANKLGIRSREGLAIFAIQTGLVFV